ncbi:hypothetical protein JOF29_003131 [Kribbella aluminosa]|uniref:Uncharacterized protein n=1 Tax=Kribbella aluminosa TaxID=416017 RepID=A0ABS4UK90_9ACTN|nr:hypothetical protein [Kribbella aluminosa]
MPHSTAPRKIDTIPDITRMTAMIHRMNPMALPLC